MRSIALTLRIRELDDKGAIVNEARLTDAGFSVGDRVRRKCDDKEASIVSMNATAVTLEIGGDQFTCSSQSFLKGDWKVLSQKAQPQYLDDSERTPPTDAEESLGV